MARERPEDDRINRQRRRRGLRARLREILEQQRRRGRDVGRGPEVTPRRPDPRGLIHFRFFLITLPAPVRAGEGTGRFDLHGSTPRRSLRSR